MVRVLVTGCHGQLGSALMAALNSRFTVIGCSKKDLDLSDKQSIKAQFDAHKPELVLNAAAYTAVDRAEEAREQAFAINHLGPTMLAQLCSHLDIPLIHFSTDYVFDGSGTKAWLESDTPAPLSVYGASKLAGEKSVLETSELAMVLRTSWVFSSHGQNFVKTMLRLGQQRDELSVVDDQWGAPTSAAFLASMVSQMLSDDKDELRDMVAKRSGLYHLCCAGETTWYGFAREIFSTAAACAISLKIKDVHAISTEDYPTPATRPKNSRLDCSKFFQTFAHLKQMTWQQALQQVIKELAD